MIIGTAAYVSPDGTADEQSSRLGLWCKRRSPGGVIVLAGLNLFLGAANYIRIDCRRTRLTKGRCVHDA
jgi:hypothetical protein